jgi:hypothetical protein
VCGELRDIVVAKKCTVVAIQPLTAAIAAVRPTVEHLTPQHGMLFQCCLLSRVGLYQGNMSCGPGAQ